jgi:poly-gamma-glutamate synthesis protein (capsule biosynthesis protein)
LLNDYEGISGYAAFRDDLALLYFVTMAPCTGTLRRLAIVPMQIKRFRLQHVTTADARWLRDMLQRQGGKFGTGVALQADNTLTLQWD